MIPNGIKSIIINRLYDKHLDTYDHLVEYVDNLYINTDDFDTWESLIQTVLNNYGLFVIC